MGLSGARHEIIKDDIVGFMIALKVSPVTPYSFCKEDLMSLSTIQVLMSSILVHLCGSESPSRVSGVQHGLELLSRLLGCTKTIFKLSKVERAAVINFVAKEWGFMKKLSCVFQEPVKLEPLRLTTGTQVPLGNMRRAIIVFFHDLILAGDGITATTLSRLPFLQTLVDLFWEYPYNSILHGKVKSIIIVLLEKDIEEVTRKLILETNFLTNAVAFLQNSKKDKCCSFHVHLVEIMEWWDKIQSDAGSGLHRVMTLFSSREPQVYEDWEHHLWFYVNPHSNNILLGGVPKPTKGSDSLERKPRKRKNSRRNSMIIYENSEEDMELMIYSQILLKM